MLDAARKRPYTRPMTKYRIVEKRLKDGRAIFEVQYCEGPPTLRQVGPSLGEVAELRTWKPESQWHNIDAARTCVESLKFEPIVVWEEP